VHSSHLNMNLPIELKRNWHLNVSMCHLHITHKCRVAIGNQRALLPRV